MRLFTAITFNEDVKKSLYQTIEYFQNSKIKGSYTSRNNLHLTLNFIGETEQIEQVEEAMQKAVLNTKITSFMLSIGGFGKFKRKDGDICWIGVEKEDNLWRLQKELIIELKKVGIRELDEREFKPHLTLGRRVLIEKNFDEKIIMENINLIQMSVSKISLMKSERIGGKLKYIEVFCVNLL